MFLVIHEDCPCSFSVRVQDLRGPYPPLRLPEDQAAETPFQPSVLAHQRLNQESLRRSSVLHFEWLVLSYEHCKKTPHPLSSLAPQNTMTPFFEKVQCLIVPSPFVYAEHVIVYMNKRVYT